MTASHDPSGTTPGQQPTGGDAEHKRVEDREDTALAVVNARQDTEHKRVEDREDTALAVVNARQDAEHKRVEDREDTALTVTNARQDTEHKRVEDRDDTALTVTNARQDTALAVANAREDTALAVANAREDTALAVANARQDTQLAVANARWDTEHKRDEDRQDTADALTHSREDTALAAEWTLFEAVHAGYIAVAQSTLDRAMQRGTYIATAAGAVVTLYTGLLGLRFGTGSHTTLLPARGILPALFLGAAVVFSTIYISFLRQRSMVTELLPSGLGGRIAQERLENFIEWVIAGAVARAWALRVAVISFGLGLILLPVTFVQLSSGAITALGVTAAAILVLWILGEALMAVAGPPGWLDRALGSNRRRFASLPPDLPPPPPPSAWRPPVPPVDPYAPVPLDRPAQAGSQPPRPQDQAAAGQPSDPARPGGSSGD